MNLKSKADELMLKTFEAICNAGGGHFGGSLSAIEIKIGRASCRERV